MLELNGKHYTVRLRLNDALHVAHNLTDRDHSIDHRQICTLLRESAFQQSQKNPEMYRAFYILTTKFTRPSCIRETMDLLNPKQAMPSMTSSIATNLSNSQRRILENKPLTLNSFRELYPTEYIEALRLVRLGDFPSMKDYLEEKNVLRGTPALQ
jgi:hypothetical protein